MRGRSLGRLIGLLFLNFLFLGVIIFSFRYFGFIESDSILNYEKWIPFQAKDKFFVRDLESETLVSQDIINQEKALNQRESFLDAREKALNEVEKSYKLLLRDLKQKQEELSDREKVLLQKERDKKDKQKNIEDIALKISQMEPVKAVRILNGLNSMLVIDIFYYIDEKSRKEAKSSIVPYLISLMDPQKVQEIIQLKTSDYENFKNSFIKNSQISK